LNLWRVQFRQINESSGEVSDLQATIFVVGGDVVPVPEPRTMLDPVTALGYGALFKRKYSDKKKS
jgi:hypothetical protein